MSLHAMFCNRCSGIVIINTSMFMRCLVVIQEIMTSKLIYNSCLMVFCKAVLNSYFAAHVKCLIISMFSNFAAKYVEITQFMIIEISEFIVHEASKFSEILKTNVHHLLYSFHILSFYNIFCINWFTGCLLWVIMCNDFKAIVFKK